MEAEMCAMFAAMQPALPTLNLWQVPTATPYGVTLMVSHSWVATAGSAKGDLAKYSRLSAFSPFFRFVIVSSCDRATLPPFHFAIFIFHHCGIFPFCRLLRFCQLDGRPMSGDIGAGATRAAVLLAQRVMRMAGRPPGGLSQS